MAVWSAGSWSTSISKKRGRCDAAENFAVPVKLWALGCTIVGISMTSDTVLTCVLAVTGFLYLGAQRNWRLLRSMACFMLLGVLLYLIRFQDFHLVVFSEFYVLMFWNLFAGVTGAWDLITTPPGELSSFLSRIHTPTAGVFGLLVMFRFFPTMKSELRSVWLSMRNRGLQRRPSSCYTRRLPASMCLFLCCCAAFRSPISSLFLPWPVARKARANGAAIMKEV